MISHPSCQGTCDHFTQTSVPPTTQPPVWLEQRVVLFFRLWHMIFLCSGGVLTIVILLCCCFKCRIPRTKQEIESDFRRKKVTRKFRRELNKMHMDEIDIRDIRGVLDKVREKFHRKSSLLSAVTTTADQPEALKKTPRILRIFTLSSKKKTQQTPKSIVVSNGDTTDVEGEERDQDQEHRKANNSDVEEIVVSMETGKL